MRHEKQRGEKKAQRKKRGCATSNSEYLRVKCALQFFPLAGPWECNALALCLGKCVPYVWALHPSMLSSPERGATGQGARERCLWLGSFFFHTDTYGAWEKEKGRERGRDGVGQNRKAMALWLNLSVGGPEPPHLLLFASHPQLLNTFGTSRLAFKQSCRG